MQLGFIASSYYFILTVAQLFQLTGKAVIPKWVFMLCTMIALGLHGYLLYIWIDTSVGQNLSTTNMLSFLAWLIVGFLFIAALKKPMAVLFTLLFPIAGLSIAFALLFPSNAVLSTEDSPFFLQHIFASLTAVSLLCIAGLQAIAIAIQHYLLRHPKLGKLDTHLPALQTMERTLFQFIWIGFILLTIVIAASFIHWGFQLPTNYLSKVALSGLAWALFACLLLGHHRYGWRGIFAVKWTLLGTALLIGMYVLSKSYLENF